MKFFSLSTMKFFLLRSNNFTQRPQTSSLISAWHSARICSFCLSSRVLICGILAAFGQQVAPFCRTLTTTTDAIITNSEFSLLVHFCTCSQTVCCDRQFFPVAIYCTLLHRENGSSEVLCLHPPSVTVDRRQLHTIHL